MIADERMALVSGTRAVTCATPSAVVAGGCHRHRRLLAAMHLTARLHQVEVKPPEQAFLPTLVAGQLPKGGQESLPAWGAVPPPPKSLWLRCSLSEMVGALPRQCLRPSRAGELLPASLQ